MKKKIASKLTLGKRAVATLSDEGMAGLQGGGYTSAGGSCNSCGCGPFTTCLGTGSCSR
jgi:hypothetical protein